MEQNGLKLLVVDYTNYWRNCGFAIVRRIAETHSGKDGNN